MLKIADFFISISQEVETLSNSYQICGDISESNLIVLIDIIQDLITRGLIKQSSNIQLEGEPYTFYNITELSDSLDEKSETNKSISVTLDKQEDPQTVLIISLVATESFIKKALIEPQQTLQLLNDFFVATVWLLEYSLQTPIKYVNNEKTPKQYVQEIKKNIQFDTPKQIGISPYNIDLDNMETIENDVFKSYTMIASSLKSFLSLLFIASKVDIKNNEIVIYFDGHRERSFKLNVEEILTSFSNLRTYRDLFFWIYKKEDNKSQNFHERLEVVRNLVALTFEKKDDVLQADAHDYNILKKARSSYDLYLTSKTKEYFDLRFKVEDHTEKIFSTLGDEFSKFTEFFRTNLYVFIGFLFTTALFIFFRTQATGLVSGKDIDKILTNSTLSLIISVYGLFSLLLLLLSVLTLYSNVKDLDNKKDDLENKYNNFFDTEDLDDIIGQSFTKRKKRNTIWAVGITIIWAVISLSLIFNSYGLNQYYKYTQEKSERPSLKD